MADCSDCENSRCWGRCWVLPIVYPISQMWRIDYEHNYGPFKSAQLRPPVTKMVIGSINLAQGNRIMSSFYHFAYWKLHTNDKKCHVYRGGGKEGQQCFITTFNQLVQQGNRWTAWSKADTSLKAWTVLHGLLVTDRYLPQHLNSYQRNMPRGTLNSSARVAYRAHG